MRDSSVAVLPGVTVEATSPSLTEKARTAVSDGTGQYRIVSKNGDAVMGEVYLAEDTKLDRNVAIKYLHEEFSKDAD